MNFFDERFSLPLFLLIVPPQSEDLLSCNFLSLISDGLDSFLALRHGLDREFIREVRRLIIKKQEKNGYSSVLKMKKKCKKSIYYLFIY